MKIWEKIATDFPDNKFQSKEQIEDGMHFYKWLPCDCNDEHKYISVKQMNELCAKHELECKACLKEWLDCEVSTNET